MTWLKQKWPGVLLILFLLGEFVYSKDWFFIQILLYVLVLKVLFEADLTNTLRLYLLTAIWGTFISAFGLAIYGNFILPDTINPPDWLEYLRSGAGLFTMFGLLVAGLVINDKSGKGEDKN